MFRFAHSADEAPKIGLFMGKIATFERVRKYHPLRNSYDWNDFLSVKTTNPKGDHTMGMCRSSRSGHKTAVNKKCADRKSVHLSFFPSPATLFAGGERL